jgi:hypothetical protein
LSRRRRALAAVAGAALAAWAIELVPTLRHQLDTAAMERAGSAALLASKTIPSASSLYFERARLRAEQQFPADRRGSMEDLAIAFPAMMLDGRLWLLAARNQAFLGNAEGARAALGTLEHVEPLYPDAGLRAAQLWSLLGEPARATAEARRIAALGPVQRRDVAVSMGRLGYTLPAVAEAIDLCDLPPREAAALLPLLPAGTVAELEAALQRAPREWLDEPELRAAIVARASSPMFPEALLAVWRHREPSAAARGGVLLANTNLAAPAFADPIALGWAPPSARSGVVASWSAPADAATSGTITLLLEGAAARRATRLSIYRLPLLPHEDTETIRLPLRAVGGNAVTAWLSAEEGITLRGRDVMLHGDWRDVELTLPPRREGLMATLVLHLRWATGPTPKVIIGGIDVASEAAP